MPDIWLVQSTDQLHLLPCQAHWEEEGLSWIPTPGTHLTCFTHCHFVIVTKGQAQNGPEELVHIPARNLDPVNTENTPKKAEQLSARSHLKTFYGQG